MRCKVYREPYILCQKVSLFKWTALIYTKSNCTAKTSLTLCRPCSQFRRNSSALKGLMWIHLPITGHLPPAGNSWWQREQSFSAITLFCLTASQEQLVITLLTTTLIRSMNGYTSRLFRTYTLKSNMLVHKDLLRDFRRNHENACFLMKLPPWHPLNTMDIHNLCHIYPGIRDSCDWCLLPPCDKLHAPSQRRLHSPDGLTEWNWNSKLSLMHWL